MRFEEMRNKEQEKQENTRRGSYDVITPLVLHIATVVVPEV